MISAHHVSRFTVTDLAKGLLGPQEGRLKKRALISGITGQDGSYLAEFLIGKGYEVHGIKRRTSTFNTSRIDHLHEETDQPDRRLFLHHGDLNDPLSIMRIVEATQPEEIYNLGAQSHVAVSFEEPGYTANSDALGALRMLEAVRILGLTNKARFYQASTSELYGLTTESPQTEATPFHPAVPMAWRSCMRTGSRSTTARPMGCTPATGFSSTTNRRCEERLS